MFNTDPQRYSQDTAKLAYTVSLLRGSSKRWFPLHVNQSTGIVAFSSFHTFITALKEAFNDLDSATTAEPKLRSLTQGTDSCSTFHSKFVSYVAILNLDEKSQVMWFRNSLREQVKDLLIARYIFTNFNDFVGLCIKLDNAWRSRQEEKHSPRTTNPLRFNSITTAGRRTTATGTALRPMDLSLVNCKLSPEVRQYRMANNIGNYCRQSSHLDRDCPNKKNHSQKVAVVIPGIPKPPSETVFQSNNLGTQD